MKYLTINNPDGTIFSRSTNMRGIRRYVTKQPVSVVEITGDRSTGNLYIEFTNRKWFQCDFESFEVLKLTIRNWRNLSGVVLFINGSAKGRVGYNNIHLQPRTEFK